MSTITERHNLNFNDYIEVITVHPIFHDGERSMFGRFERPSHDGTGIVFTRGDGWPPLALRGDQIRSVRKRTPAQIALQHYVGEKVTIRKYGGSYSGKVVKIGRTRVTVRFTTNGGKEKETSIPAWMVQPWA